MFNINTKIFELFDEKFDLVFFWITTHVTKLFVFVAGDDLIDGSGYTVGNGDFGFVGGT